MQYVRAVFESTHRRSMQMAVITLFTVSAIAAIIIYELAIISYVIITDAIIYIWPTRNNNRRDRSRVFLHRHVMLLDDRSASYAVRDGDSAND